ncbi:hypothetical protein ARMSODRAFT_178276 [Armillaria solidipes]|uniref:RING-type domain-containing protein n=1 Tax=Armillaria solidipes TaxID=1076256 RepID=A0A2H3BQE1_9AGAR|nr:hypothetical protein ARMSODRAFT_178276 [Armillaria solidipes]
MVQSCAICLSQCDNLVSTPCGHIFCQICISKHVLRSNGFQSFCPTCREKFLIGQFPDFLAGSVALSVPYSHSRASASSSFIPPIHPS